MVDSYLSAKYSVKYLLDNMQGADSCIDDLLTHANMGQTNASAQRSV